MLLTSIHYNMFNSSLSKYDDPTAKFLVKMLFSSKPFVKQHLTANSYPFLFTV